MNGNDRQSVKISGCLLSENTPKWPYTSKRFCWFCYTWLRVVLFEVSVAYI